ncbi:MAG: hypothetical protein WBK55_04260 [Alphaproteobacteria bacterium]
MDRSLAQSIIKTSYCLSVEPDAVRESIVDHVMSWMAGKHEKEEMGPEKYSELVSKFYSFYRDIADIAADLPSSMRFAINHDVADAVAKMSNTSTSTLLRAFNYARLPFPKTWIEYTARGWKDKEGWLLQEMPGEKISLKFVESYTGFNAPLYERYAQHFLISRDGFNFAHTPATEKDYKRQSQSGMEKACRDALSVLLLLNSRSNIIRVQHENDLGKLNAKRRKQGHRTDLLSIHAIHFDIARLLKQNPAMSAGEASESMAAALVRGHFKVRQTGVFFWSPYVRAASSQEEKARIINARLQDDRGVGKSGQSALPGGAMPELIT